MQFIIALKFRKMDLIYECVSVAENIDEESDYLSKTLCTPIDGLNKKRIRDSMNGEVPEDEILSELNSDKINQKSMTTLLPREWLNGEVINSFMSCLIYRDRHFSFTKRYHNSNFSHF